jgi:acyl CoA:acetate/3-ketoacid CoA transferase beta subunit
LCKRCACQNKDGRYVCSGIGKPSRWNEVAAVKRGSVFCFV